MVIWDFKISRKLFQLASPIIKKHETIIERNPCSLFLDRLAFLIIYFNVRVSSDNGFINITYVYKESQDQSKIS